MAATFRPFDAEVDTADVVRIWHETRWIDSDNEGQRRALETFLGGGAAEVGVIDGAAECLVHRTPGTIDYDRTTLPASVISAVTTSHVGRRQRLASTLTARALAHGSRGAAQPLRLLGMFEQGFYDRFGFATGAPMLIATFDPESLRVDHVPYRPPVRLGLDDARAMGDAMRRRLPHHGRVTLDAVDLMAAEWGFIEQPFALGYREGDRMTHFVAGSLKEENGPFEIQFCSYETGDQLLELLRLLHELGDQVHSVEIVEPPHLQLHPLIDAPNRQRSRSRRGAHETATRAATWWQLRILDVPAVRLGAAMGGAAGRVRSRGAATRSRRLLQDAADDVGVVRHRRRVPHPHRRRIVRRAHRRSRRGRSAGTALFDRLVQPTLVRRPTGNVACTRRGDRGARLAARSARRSAAPPPTATRPVLLIAFGPGGAIPPRFIDRRPGPIVGHHVWTFRTLPARTELAGPMASAPYRSRISSSAASAAPWTASGLVGLVQGQLMEHRSEVRSGDPEQPDSG